jgi:hypothetical protein
MQLVFTDHFKLQILERKISEKTVKDVLETSEQIFITGTIKVAQKTYFDSTNKKEYLIRVIFEEKNDCKKLITAYKTSKIEKYSRR